MQRPSWSGQLRISLVSFGVSLIPATESKGEVHFHQLDKRTGARVRNQLVSSEDGKPVERNEIVKGYEYAKNEFVQIDPDEVSQLRIPSRSTIEVEQFVSEEEIAPALYEKPYFVVPESAATAEAFAVVRAALGETRQAAVGKIALSGRERLIAFVAPRDAELRGIYAYTLRFADEMRDAREYFADIKEQKIVPEQLSLAKDLIRQKSAPFNPERFHDEYEDALREMIEAKLKHVPVPREERQEPRGKVIDLMEALRRSVEGVPRKPPARAAAKTASRGKVQVMPTASHNARGKRKTA